MATRSCLANKRPSALLKDMFLTGKVFFHALDGSFATPYAIEDTFISEINGYEMLLWGNGRRSVVVSCLLLYYRVTAT